jgi:hypothetical protein
VRERPYSAHPSGGQRAPHRAALSPLRAAIPVLAAGAFVATFLKTVRTAVGRETPASAATPASSGTPQGTAVSFEDIDSGNVPLDIEDSPGDAADYEFSDDEEYPYDGDAIGCECPEPLVDFHLLNGVTEAQVEANPNPSYVSHTYNSVIIRGAQRTSTAPHWSADTLMPAEELGDTEA